MSGVLVDDYQRYHFEPDLVSISNAGGLPLHPAAAGAGPSPWSGCDPLDEAMERDMAMKQQQQWQQQAMAMKQEPEPYNLSEGGLLSEEEEILCRALCKLGFGGKGGAGQALMATAGGRCGLPSSNKEEGQWLVMQDFLASDEFRMFEFKVRRCMRGRSHDWTECPFAHPGEKARRRDPRRFHYAGAACPDFRKGSCRRGDSCEFSHGVFECWLHPARYRTQLCKDGAHCTRRICFFAHSPSQLRLLPSPDDLQQQLPPMAEHRSYLDAEARLSCLNVTMSDAASFHANPAFSPSHHALSTSMDDFSCNTLARTAGLKQAISAREGATSAGFRQLMAASKLRDPVSSHLSSDPVKQAMADARYVYRLDDSDMMPHGAAFNFKQAMKDEIGVYGSSTVPGPHHGCLYQQAAASNESSDDMRSMNSRVACSVGDKPSGLLNRSQFWPNNDGADGISTLSDLARADECGLAKNHPARPGLLINKLNNNNVSGFSNQFHHQLPSPTSTLVGHSPSPPPLSPPLSPAISPPMSPNLPSLNWSNPLVRRISAISGQTPSLDALSQIQASLAASQLFSNGSSMLSYAHGPSPLSCNSPVHQGHQLDRVNFNSPVASFSSTMEPAMDEQAASRERNCSKALMANLQQMELRRIATEMRSKMRSAYLSRSLPNSPIAGMGRQSEAWDGIGGADVALQRVDSGRDLRAKIYGKLGKELPKENENPDFGWVNELFKSEAE